MATPAPTPPSTLNDPRVQAAMTAWERAKPRERATLIERLLQPLGPLARLAVASGAFSIYFAREHWAQVHVRLEDAADFSADQVMDLARFAFEVQPDVLQGLVSVNPGDAGGVVGVVGLATAILLALWRR